MNLYDLLNDPEKSPSYEEAHEKVPSLVWKKYGNNPEELHKRAHIFTKDAEMAYDYARLYLHKRFSEAEDVIMTNPHIAVMYAQHVIQGRWPEAEPILAQNAKAAYNYADRVIGGRFPEGEKAIANSPEYAYYYADEILHGPFPEAEKTVFNKKNPKPH